MRLEEGLLGGIVGYLRILVFIVGGIRFLGAVFSRGGYELIDFVYVFFGFLGGDLVEGYFCVV